jgi:hypothetical protein
MPDRSPTTIIVGTLVGALAASAVAIAVPTTQVGARNAMLVPADARAAGLPASLREVFEPEFNERIWLCDAKGTSEVKAGASPVTYVASTEQLTRGVVTELIQDISVFATPEEAQAVFQQVVSKAKSCKGTVVATEGGAKAPATRITRSNGTASFTSGGQAAVWTAQVTPGPEGRAALNEAQYNVFQLNGNVIQSVELDLLGRSATKVTSAQRNKVNALAQTLAARWTTAP